MRQDRIRRAIDRRDGGETGEYATAIKIDAMTLMGEMLKTGPKNTGAKGSTVTGSKREPVKDSTPTLADMGIGKKESSDAQKLAAYSLTLSPGRSSPLSPAAA